jgi:hypothetical protein
MAAHPAGQPTIIGAGLAANAPERLHDEIAADYTDMIYADTPQEVQKRRKAFLRKWRLRHGAVASCLPSQSPEWKTAKHTPADRVYPQRGAGRGSSPGAKETGRMT